MVINEYAPRGILADYIESYMVVSSEQEVTNTVLPETLPLLTFRYHGDFHYIIHDQSTVMPAVALSGLRSSVKNVYLAKQTGVFIVRFKELAFASFFKEPLHYFFEKGISFNALSLRHKTSAIEARLYEAEDDHKRILLVETFLTSLLKEKTKDQLIETALQKIKVLKGNIKIKELANSLNISQDAFEKRFRWAAGLSPKRFSTLVKMEYAVKNKTAHQSITDIALTLGYFDESHFIKDFKSFSGQTPFQYFKKKLLTSSR